ncbi:TTF-type domain-containing protein, partial [Aphis craccivora]
TRFPEILSYESKAKKICNHEQNDGHNDREHSTKNNVLNLNILFVDLGDIDSGQSNLNFN